MEELLPLLDFEQAIQTMQDIVKVNISTSTLLYDSSNIIQNNAVKAMRRYMHRIRMSNVTHSGRGQPEYSVDIGSEDRQQPSLSY